MIVVLEGPECVGKTTLAREIVELQQHHGLHSVYIHNGIDNSTPKNLGTQLATIRRYPSILWVFDRWYLSEYVYSALGTKECTMPYDIGSAERSYGTYADKKVLLVGVDSTTLKLRRKYSKEFEMPVDPQDEITMYEKIADDSWLRINAQHALNLFIPSSKGRITNAY